MKRMLCLILALGFLLLSACGAVDPTVTLGESELYTKTEIMNAVDVVKAEFRESEDLTLLRIKYDESYTLREMKYRKEHYGEETVIVLLADINVGLDAFAAGSFLPGHTSTDYQFILTPNRFGRWTIQDRGYA